MHTYRFDELGSLQFERLCAAILALDAVAWGERAFGRAAVLADGVRPPGERERLPGPTLVIVAWLPAGPGRGSRLRRLVTVERERTPASLLGSMLVLTNVEEPVSSNGLPTVVVGPGRISALLDAREELRLRVPSVLGVRDLDEVIEPDLARRSTLDLDAARGLARIFVPTAAYADAVAVLERKNFTVLTGPPEMGKTAIARTVGLAKLTAGWEVHECLRPETLWQAFARERRQVFIADDAFGSTEYRPEAAERWALELDRVLRAMDERHWLIWTSRPAPLTAGLRRVHREHGVERFPRPAEVQVDAAALAVEEKALILFRHARTAGLPLPAIDLVRSHGWEIVSHPHFTPERIRRFVAGPLLDLAAAQATPPEVEAAVVDGIREPTHAMAASYGALGDEHRALLLALLDAPPPPVPERALAAAVRRQFDQGFAHTPAELIDRLSDHFLRRVPPASVTWVHPSWRDLVIAQLAGDAAARGRFLERCQLDGLVLAMSVGGGSGGERTLPLLRDDADWDAVAARIAPLAGTLDETDAIRLLESLGAALEADLPTREGSELAALAQLALRRVACSWDERCAPISTRALEAWFAAAVLLEDPPPRPSVDRSWVELVPLEPVQMASRDELVRLDDWLALAQVLYRFAPQELYRFGFPERHTEVLQAFVLACAAGGWRAAGSDELVDQILRRLDRVAPTHAAALAYAKSELESEAEPWFEVRFETHPRRPESGARERLVVERVLRDLA